jgi:hypothetical protein
MKKQTLIYIAIAVVVLIVIYFLLNKNNTIMRDGGKVRKGRRYNYRVANESYCVSDPPDVYCTFNNGFCSCVMGG